MYEKEMVLLEKKMITPEGLQNFYDKFEDVLAKDIPGSENWLKTNGNEMTTHEFLPCPFCGCKDCGLQLNESSTEWFIFCFSCYARGPEKCEKKAIEAWNDRKL